MKLLGFFMVLTLMICCTVSNAGSPTWRATERDLMNEEIWAYKIRCINSTKEFWTYKTQIDKDKHGFVCRVPQEDCSPENKDRYPKDCLSELRLSNNFKFLMQARWGLDFLKACERFSSQSLSRPCPPFAVMDIVLIIDSSSSIGATNWALLIEFLEVLIRSFVIGPDSTNFAIFRYNKIVDTASQILFNDYSDVNELIHALNKIPYDGSGTMTGRALDHAYQVILKDDGNRPDVKDSVILITDGMAADDVTMPANVLRSSGVEVMVLGIQPPRGRVDSQQLFEIAGSRENVVIGEKGFADLNHLFVDFIGDSICTIQCS